MIRHSAYLQMEPVPESVSLCPDFYYWMAISRLWDVWAVQETGCYYRVRGHDFESSNAVQIFKELLFIIEHFADHIPPKELSYRRITCHNLIGITEIRAGQVKAGIQRISCNGSALRIIWQTPVHVLRRLRYFLFSAKIPLA